MRKITESWDLARPRFDNKVMPELNSGCWLWTGALTTWGYGFFYVGPVTRCIGAHIASWNFHRGPKPQNKWVLHTCDVRCCVNPDHLYLGTRADNEADKMNRGRQAKGERGTAKLTAQDVLSILGDNRTQQVIAADFGVTQANISIIKTRAGWKHLTEKAKQ
jgi:hypothetical protein